MWGRRKTGGRRRKADDSLLFEDGKAPATLCAFLAYMLLTNTPPEDIVVSEGFPSPGDLSGPA